MNYYKELNLLKQKYSTNPETKTCLRDAMRIFSNFMDGLLTKMQDKEEAEK